jgi:hypothetical protein
MKGKTVLVQLPFDDLSDHKVKPAYCLTYSIDDSHLILSPQSAHASNRAS